VCGLERRCGVKQRGRRGIPEDEAVDWWRSRRRRCGGMRKAMRSDAHFDWVMVKGRDVA
jgi:hypothetical protein